MNLTINLLIFILEHVIKEYKENKKYLKHNLKSKSQAKKIAEKVKAELFSCVELDCNEVFKNKSRLIKHRNYDHPEPKIN